MTGDGFAFDASDGWKQEANDGAEIPDSEVRAFAIDRDGSDGFNDTTSVAEDPEPAQVGTIDDIGRMRAAA